jgi:hypothetical protein
MSSAVLDRRVPSEQDARNPVCHTASSLGRWRVLAQRTARSHNVRLRRVGMQAVDRGDFRVTVVG